MGREITGNHDDKYLQELFELFSKIQKLAICNADYFCDCPGANNKRFFNAFYQLFQHLGPVASGVERLLSIASLFDYDSTTPGNGYRSFIKVIHKCCLRILALSRYIAVYRESYLFRAKYYSREIEVNVTMFGQLRACLFYLEKLVLYCEDGDLFPNEKLLSEKEYQSAEKLMYEVESLNPESFYGQCLGFQYCDSMVKPLTVINLALASYGDGYKKSSCLMKLTASVVGTGKYLLSPEMRAKQVVNMTRKCDVEFCQSFWSLAENPVIHNVPVYACPSVAVDKVIAIKFQKIEFPLLIDSSVNISIKPPCSPNAAGSVQTRLISSKYRHGQEAWYTINGYSLPFTAPRTEKSPYLILHCHGGGFVGQSSASHEVYLRHWAYDLNVPILSVDYSLAPEYQFPYQLEEAFFAYCWAIKNCNLLGSTGEKICLVGDSAGGNLAVSVAMKAAACGIQRPDGILSIYGCLFINYTPSPSRLLALMDPLIPMGVLAICLRAYAGTANETTKAEVDSAESNSISSDEENNGCDRTNDTNTDVPDGSRKNSSLELELLLLRARQFPCNSRLCHHRVDSGFFDVNLEQINQAHRNSIESQKRSLANNFNFSASQESSPIKFSVSIEENDKNSVVAPSVLKGARYHLPPKSHFCKSISTPTFQTSKLSFIKDHGIHPVSTFAKLSSFQESPMEHSKSSKVSNSPYMSPLKASNEFLQGLCPVYMLASHLDPMLDDSIMFARRLQSLGKEVHLELISDLPHGFLNFVLVSREAMAASKRCVSNIQSMLDLNSS